MPNQTEICPHCCRPVNSTDARRRHELAHDLQQLTHFLDELWTLQSNPQSRMCDIIERIGHASSAAHELPHIKAGVKVQHVLRRARIIIGRDRDTLWCETPEEAVELVQERMATAYAKCGKELEDLAAELLLEPETTTHEDHMPLDGVKADLVNAVREIGPNGKRTQKAILDYLESRGLEQSTGYTKQCLAELVRLGVLVKGAGGYRLPEWKLGPT